MNNYLWNVYLYWFHSLYPYSILLNSFCKYSRMINPFPLHIVLSELRPSLPKVLSSFLCCDIGLWKGKQFSCRYFGSGDMVSHFISMKFQFYLLLVLLTMFIHLWLDSILQLWGCFLEFKVSAWYQVLRSLQMSYIVLLGVGASGESH